MWLWVVFGEGFGGEMEKVVSTSNLQSWWEVSEFPKFPTTARAMSFAKKIPFYDFFSIFPIA